MLGGVARMQKRPSTLPRRVPTCARRGPRSMEVAAVSKRMASGAARLARKAPTPVRISTPASRGLGAGEVHRGDLIEVLRAGIGAEHEAHRLPPGAEVRHHAGGGQVAGGIARRADGAFALPQSCDEILIIAFPRLAAVLVEPGGVCAV